MTSRAISAFLASAGAFILVGCAADPPADLSHLPRDAAAVWGVDMGAIAEWKGAVAPSPLAQLGSQAWRDGIAACGLDIKEVDVVGAGTDLADVVVVLRAPGLGEGSTLECLGRAEWRGAAAEPWWTIADGALVRNDGTAIGRAISKDAVVIATDPSAHDLVALAEGSDEAWPEPMREMMALVDHGAAIWGAVAPTGDDASSAPLHGVAFDVALPEDAIVHAIVRPAEGDTADAMAETIEAKLREVSGWIYAPPAVVDRAEIEAKDGRVELRVSIALSQWQGMDLRFVDERRGIVAPAAAPEPEREVVAALVQARPVVEVAVEVMAAPAPVTGIASCDDYLEKYRACIEDKIPEAARKPLKEALATTIDAWKQAAASPAGASALDTACVAARDASQQATAAMGCSW